VNGQERRQTGQESTAQRLKKAVKRRQDAKEPEGSRKAPAGAGEVRASLTPIDHLIDFNNLMNLKFKGILKILIINSDYLKIS